MGIKKKVAWIFPGQGAQYPGMGKEFYASSSTVRELFEESDDLLSRNLSKVILEGPVELLTETRNSQTAIFMMSIALARVLRESFPDFKPDIVAGLSLGEYSALHEGGFIAYSDCLSLVQFRGEAMNDACMATNGTMAVVLGLSAEAVEGLVEDIALPRDLWAANFNCPGQVVISGTQKGIEAGTKAALAAGAKRVLPLQVHGAFHSGLMREAEERLSSYIADVPICKGTAELVMNVSAAPTSHLETIRQQLVKQVTSPVRWEQSILAMMASGVDLFVEIGCGKTLSGFNKRIGGQAVTISVEKPEDMERLAEALK